MRLNEILDYSKDQRRALISIAVAALILAAFFTFSSRGEAVETPVVKLSTESPRKSLFVHVAGDVRRPGVYPILEGARVVDAINAAGGARPGVDLSNINLARILVDGEQVFVGKQKKSSSARTGSYRGVVYLNRASLSQFDSLPGIGPVIARRILDYRLQNGPFVDIADLQKVEGIGAKTFEKIKGRISL